MNRDGAAAANGRRRRSHDPIGVMLLISSLEAGGAERQVIELARSMDRRRFRPVICSLSEHVPLASGLSENEVDLVVVPKRWKFDVTAVTRVARLMIERRIRIVHAFLFDAEMVARLAGRIGRMPIVISSERNTDYQRPALHTACFHLTRVLSNGWIANSHSGKRFLIRTLGVDREDIFVVHNGVDVERFRPANGNAVRKELGIPSDDLVVGMVASFKRQKNHHHFFRMARQLRERFANSWFLCVGEPLRDNQQGAMDYHREMRTLLSQSGLGDRCRLLGVRGDMPAVYNACDVTVLTSSREGTPNVLLESMACGAPVVATDVSDNAYVVPDGRSGFIVALGDVSAMCDRVSRLLNDASLRTRMGEAGRAWVEEEFSLSSLADRTQAIYNKMLRRRRDAQGGRKGSAARKRDAMGLVRSSD